MPTTAYLCNDQTHTTAEASLAADANREVESTELGVGLGVKRQHAAYMVPIGGRYDGQGELVSNKVGYRAWGSTGLAVRL